MRVLDSRSKPGVTSGGFALRIALVATLLTVSAVAVCAFSVWRGSVQTEDGVDALALKWFREMQTGHIDRTQLATDYNAQLTDDAVQGMSRYLKEYKYGASPTRAEVVQTRTIGRQTLYVVKLVFPRGDAASLLFGFNTEGKITGISLLSMAGD
jgi:hypothetical protein